MQPFRFRLQTLMVVIAAFALLMVSRKSLSAPFFDNMIAFTGTLVVLVVTAGGLLLVVIGFLAAKVVELFACRG